MEITEITAYAPTEEAWTLPKIVAVCPTPETARLMGESLYKGIPFSIVIVRVDLNPSQIEELQVFGRLFLSRAEVEDVAPLNEE